MLSVLLNWLKLVYGPSCTVNQSYKQQRAYCPIIYIPSYIVMMAQLIIKKQFTIVFELLRRRRSKLQNCKKFLGVSHLSLHSPKYTFLAKKLFPVYLQYFHFQILRTGKLLGDRRSAFLCCWPSTGRVPFRTPVLPILLLAIVR